MRKQKLQSILQNKSGFSILEAVLALLVLGVVVLVFVSMVTVAGNLNTDTAEKESSFYEDLSNAERMTVGEDAVLTVTFAARSDLDATIDVSVKTEGRLRAYIDR